MKAKRKVAARPMKAQVISLDAYRRAHGLPAAASAPLREERVSGVYWRWLVACTAFWALWW